MKREITKYGFELTMEEVRCLRIACENERIFLWDYIRHQHENFTASSEKNIKEAKRRLLIIDKVYKHLRLTEGEDGKQAL